MTDYKERVLRPLDMLKAVRKDETLTTSQAMFLVACILRTDNQTCKVRASLEMLANDAKLSERHVTRLIKEPQVARYFAKIEGKTRAKNLWFHPVPDMIPDMVSEKDDSDSGHGVWNDADTKTAGDNDSGHGVHNSGHGVHNSRHGVTPSALTSTLTSTDDAINAGASLSSDNQTLLAKEDEPSLAIKDDAPDSRHGRMPGEVEEQPSLTNNTDARAMGARSEQEPSLAKNMHAAPMAHDASSLANEMDAAPEAHVPQSGSEEPLARRTNAADMDKRTSSAADRVSEWREYYDRKTDYKKLRQEAKANEKTWQEKRQADEQDMAEIWSLLNEGNERD